jgi:CHAD domain-containing protein
MSALHARHKLLQARLDRFTRMLPGVETGDVRAIHRTRVATRRLREVLPVLQLGGHTADKLGRRLRRATRRLGEVREMDVLLNVLDEMRAAGESSSRMLGQMAGDIKRARDEAQDERVGKGLVLELNRLARKLADAAKELSDGDEGPERERGWRWAVDARVARRAEMLKAAIASAGALYIPERLHDVRIALKKLRYAMEVASEASGEDRAADLRALKRGQDILGRLHDLQVLIERARRAQASLDTPDLTMWREFDVLLASLEKACRRLHARYVRERAVFLAICARHVAKPARAKHAAVRRAG